MSTIKNANGWTDTNSIEAHLRREGRIVGKIIRGFKHVQGPDGIWLDKPLPWVCQRAAPACESSVTVATRVRRNNWSKGTRMNKRTLQYLQYAVNGRKVRFRKTPTEGQNRPAARPSVQGMDSQPPLPSKRTVRM